jgi:hypothetical protein
LDEVIELSWQHILPHFRECWWDHLGCDILLSNIPAITFGLWLQRRLGLIPYDFWGKEGTQKNTIICDINKKTLFTPKPKMKKYMILLS